MCQLLPYAGKILKFCVPVHTSSIWTTTVILKSGTYTYGNGWYIVDARHDTTLSGTSKKFVLYVLF